ncbi:single-stranded DNA-binding protein, partial [Paenarthrobacter nitroguajacolicus]
TGFETAKVNSTQRNSNQGAGNGGGFGNQPSNGQPVQQDDPWAANKQTNAGSWGNGPDSEPPF